MKYYRRDLLERYGKWTTIYSRFQRWRKSGVWDKMLAELQKALDVESKVDWEIHFIDSTTVRAHLIFRRVSHIIM
jgi:transposase